MHFSSEIKITDFATSISVIFAALTLLYSWRKDRILRAREYADRIRSAASTVLAKTDRCQSIFLSLYDIIQPVITEADTTIVETQNPLICRDMFWKKLNELRLTIMNTFRDEQIEIAYAPMLAYRTSMYDLFTNAVNAARNIENRFFWNLQETSQAVILSCRHKHMQNAELGNLLRERNATCASNLNVELDAALSEIREFLRRTISLSDPEILSSANRRR